MEFEHAPDKGFSVTSVMGFAKQLPLYWDTDKYCEAFSKTGFISTLILLYFSVLDERTILENLQARYSYDQIYVSWIIDH